MQTATRAATSCQRTPNDGLGTHREQFDKVPQMLPKGKQKDSLAVTSECYCTRLFRGAVSHETDAGRAIRPREARTKETSLGGSIGMGE